MVLAVARNPCPVTFSGPPPIVRRAMLTVFSLMGLVRCRPKNTYFLSMVCCRSSPKYSKGLLWKRHNVGLPHLHFFCRNGPESGFYVNVLPLHLPEFAGAYKKHRGKFKGTFDCEGSKVAVYVKETPAEFFGVEYR